MTESDTDERPSVRFLSGKQKTKIHEAVLRVLGEIGMQVSHEEALSLLKKAGCNVQGDGIVKFPPSIVEKRLSTVPHHIPVFNREGELAMDLGGFRSYFGTGSDLIFSLDAKDLERRLSTLEDVKQAARVADALPNIDFIMSFAHPSDVSTHEAFLLEFQAMAENSLKPIVCTSDSCDDLRKMWEIGRILRGSESQLRSEPYFIHYAEPISPLKHPFNSLNKLLFCAEKGIPVVYSPAPNAGAAAPITVAGHVVQGLAECFCGMIIHQLRSEGAPVIMGMGPAVLDMTTSQPCYNAPEYYLAYVAAIEMSHYYDLPSWGYAGTSDSQLPDGQATFEAGLLTFISALSGANLNHDIGYLNFGLTGNLEMVVIVDEMIDEIRRLMQGIPVDDGTLAIDAIREIGQNGNFLIHPHTLKYLRTTQWRPKLISRVAHDSWKHSGGLSLLDRARKKVQSILQTHEIKEIAQEKTRGIQNVLNEFRKTPLHS